MINATNMPLPRDIPAMIGNVQAFFAQGRMDLLAAEIAPLLKLLPNEAALHNVAGVAHAGLGRLGEAVAAYDRAVALQPDFADAWINRGISLKALGRLEEALIDYDRALEIAPFVPANHYSRANVLLDLRRADEAVAAYDRAISLQPAHAEAHSNRGNALHQIGRLNEAVESFERAIACKPAFAEAHVNLGGILHELRRMDEAAGCYAEALRLDPGHPLVLARMRLLKAHMCDWADDGLGDVASLGVETDAVPTFGMLAFDDDPGRNLIRSTRWAKAHHSARQHVASPPVGRSGRIRLGYFSADFHNHATMYLIAGLLERHDRSRFEIHLFSYGPDRQDGMRRRAMAAVDAFHDVRTLSDAEVAVFARDQGIDIAVDLKGYTQDSRIEIFAFGAAPVQITWLGYPGTSGGDLFDYVVADAVVVPDDKRRFYTEKLISLPHSYQVNDDRREIAVEKPARATVGLPETGFVFCCFNNSFKISPREFSIWMRLLSQAEGSVLWLLRDNDFVISNLRKAAAAHGVSPDRLVFADRLPLPQHLARQRCADLFLDSFAYNAHTTASDALWAGLPVVTRLGEGFAARVGGSLLHAVGLPELVTDTDAAYEALALSLALEPGGLAAIRGKLLVNRGRAPLFDTTRFARDLEEGFVLALDRYRSGLAPDHIAVPAAP